MSNPFTTKDPLFDVVAQVLLGEKKLTDAELKKREEIVLAIKRENPDMEKSRAYAIATAQAKKVAEEVEQIDEIHSPGTKVRIPHKGKMVTGKVVRHDKGSMGESPAYVVYVGEYESAKVPAHKVQKVNEEVEQIDEISDKTLGNYVSKAVVDVHNDARFAGESGSKDASKKAFKRLLGVKSAAARLSNQNVSGGRISSYRSKTAMFGEQLNLQEITTKSGADVDRNLEDHDPDEHGDIPDRKPDHELETHGGMTLHVHHVKDSKGKTTHTIINHVHDPAGGGTYVVKGHAHPKHILSSYNRAEREDMDESVNLDEQLENFWEAYTTMFNEAEDQQQNILLRAMAKDPSDLMKMKRAIKMGDKALTNPALRQEILAMLDKMMNLTTADPSLLQRTKMGFQKAKKLNMPEEVQLEAIGAKDKQDEGEYGYEGDMAMSQLRTIIRNCQEMMKVLDKETDMPEWVQSKITLATDYLQTANDYLMSELEEEAEIDEGKVYDPITKKMVATKSSKVKAGGGVTIDGVPVDMSKYKSKKPKNEEVELGEADEKEVGKEVKAARLKKDSSDFMSKSSLFSGGARDVAKHLGKKDDEKYGEAMKKVKDTPVSKFLQTRKGDGKVRTEEAEKAPFEGGREVKSTESAAERVKRIATDAMQKQQKKDKK